MIAVLNFDQEAAVGTRAVEGGFDDRSPEARADEADSAEEKAPATVTRLLQEWREGDDQAFHRLAPMMYREIKAIAGSYRRMEGQSFTMPPTALAHEAFLRLIESRQIDWQDRSHFLTIAAKVIRHLLVDHARRRNAWKRGSGAVMLELQEGSVVVEPPDIDMLRLEDALEELARVAPRRSQIVELRFFGGMTVEETAEALGLSAPTVKRDWALAKAWIYRFMTKPRLPKANIALH